LRPILVEQVGRRFLPWTRANEKALTEDRGEFTVTLADEAWTQKPQKYHARSLGMLRAKYAAVPNKTELDQVLQSTGCLTALRT
jgi:hypothetical protein